MDGAQTWDGRAVRRQVGDVAIAVVQRGGGMLAKAKHTVWMEAMNAPENAKKEASLLEPGEGGDHHEG